MNLKGVVDSIVFRNAENGYTVLDIDADGKLITAVGIFPPISEGEQIELLGNYSQNAKYGEQFFATEVSVRPPADSESIIKYLSSGLFKGIGEVLAARIVDVFRDDTLKVIELTPAKLSSVNGISLKKAMEIGESLAKIKQMQATILHLQKFGLSVNLCVKIYKIYEERTISVLEHNPYQLIEDVEGIGFLTADKIAEAMGTPQDGKFRVTAGVIFTLSEAVSKNGHTYLPYPELSAKVKELLNIANVEALIDEVIGDLEVAGKIMLLPGGATQNIMLAKHYLAEKSIAGRLFTLDRESAVIHLDLDADIMMFERQNGIELHAMQAEAIKNSILHGVNVITGGPGTGKTTIIKCILSIFKSKGMKVQLCAPTGRAAKRLSEASGEEAKTIHRLLDLDFKDGKGYFTYNENTRLEADIVIIDEVSMCDVYVFNALVKAIKPGGRLLIVGDHDQLPSVGAGNVLADIIGSGKIPVSYLREIYRQGAESLIIKNAHLINHGEMPVIDDMKSDFFFNQKSAPAEILKTTIQMVTERIPKFMQVRPIDIQVLCPMKKGVAGVENMNRALQAAINPPRGGNEIAVGGITLREGDKVIHTVNNYQLEWHKTGPSGAESGVGVFNGDIGFIERVERGSMQVGVRFDDGKHAVYSGAELDQLMLAYAISVHKSQGSEFDVVLISIMSGNYMILTRNLLYTAVTRAKKMAVLVGDLENLHKMVRNNYTAKRYSMLKTFLVEAYEAAQ